MLYQELVTTAKKLPYRQKLQLLEELAHSLRADMPLPDTRPSSLARVRGMLKVEGASPTDQELADEYANYLSEKYT